MLQAKQFTATHILPAGFGYFDLTHYPLGGCFRRASADLPLMVESAGQFRSHGCDMTAHTAEGVRIACGEHNCRSVE